MMVVVFRSRLKTGVDAEYGQRGEAMQAIAERMPGFVASKDFVAEDGERVALIEFRSAAELESWGNHPDHRATQEIGRSRLYEQYSLQVCELLRESRFTAEPEATSDPDAIGKIDFPPYDGGCFCGAIRFRARGKPRFPSICHCSMCRRVSGAPVVAWATFRTASIEWLSGTPKRLASSEKAERSFCGDCGTALTFRFHAHPDWTDVTIGSLDEPGRIAPEDHIFTTSQIGWVRLADGLPRFPGERGEGARAPKARRPPERDTRSAGETRRSRRRAS